MPSLIESNLLSNHEGRISLYWLQGTSVRKQPLLSRIEYAFTGCSWMCNKDTIRGCEQVLTRQSENQHIFLKEQRICEPDLFLSQAARGYVCKRTPYSLCSMDQTTRLLLTAWDTRRSC